MVFNLDRVICEHHDVRVGNAKTRSFSLTGFNIPGVFDRNIAGIERLGKNHLLFLAAQTAFQDSPVALDETRFVHMETVRVYSTLNHVLAQPQRCIDEHHILSDSPLP